MYVIADIEWNTNEFGLKYPTQLAAVKVDENWNVTDRFSSFIRPTDSSFHNWWHVSYRGGSAADFLNARVAYSVLAEFLCWLDEDDILLWWYDESVQIFREFVYDILKTPLQNKAVNLGDYVHVFLAGQESCRGNAYKLAGNRGIDTNNRMKHCSENDVRVIHELVQKIGFPQVDLLKPLEKKNKQSVERKRANAHLRYQYDPATNMMHLLECDKYDHDSMQIKGHAELKVAFRRDIGICECCRADYLAMRRERNRRTMERIDCTYIYTENSDIYHRRGCFCMLNASNVQGIKHYETVVRLRKRPCSRCNPIEQDEYRPRTVEEWDRRKIKALKQSAPREVEAAMKRQRIAANARTRLLKDDLTEQQRTDIYTLTQPRFAFFSGRGYGTFHRSDCGKLRGVTNIQGFARYNDAMRTGMKPCRYCRPSPKQDIIMSIPITSRQRADDCSEILEQRCREAGYPYGYEEKYFCLETPVGKWRINTEAFPIKLKHINLVLNPFADDYHDQPRLFLSFEDVFDYIKRHDEKLMCEQLEGEGSKQNIILIRQKLKFSGAV